ncbi:protein kinase 2B [Striga asiatica]|uniref:Protein kinase 2B n=1 Tax=Striga asiatica TaxID=4170 RepID=A0A5A7PMJ8_STRAF|nr:protein kinase 2B [Striga asiatica]
MADLIAAGLQSGCNERRRPATPETWGQDMEVPDIMLKGVFRWSKSKSLGFAASLNEAIMISGVTKFGPLDEKSAMTGAGFLLSRITAVRVTDVCGWYKMRVFCDMSPIHLVIG